MTTWFTSDIHFWHRAIIQYCKRPWDDVEKMNEGLIQRWNEKIKPDDEVWFLGDFAFCGVSKAVPILERLNGVKNAVLGNHDYKLFKKLDCPMFFKSVQHYKHLRVSLQYVDEEEQPQQYGQSIILCHFPILSWDGMAHGSWMLHGHCHGGLDHNLNATGLRLDVGVDSHNWYPISLEDVWAKLALRTVVPVDHHKPEPKREQDLQGWPRYSK